MKLSFTLFSNCHKIMYCPATTKNVHIIRNLRMKRVRMLFKVLTKEYDIESSMRSGNL